MERIDIQELLRKLSEIEDTRRQWGNKRHELRDILFISLCAIMCGMMDIDGITVFGQERQAWLKQYTELKNGPPSYSTYERIFQMLEPKQLEKFYRAWAAAMHKASETAQIDIDGKTICGAGAAQKVHMVSVWAKESGLCLGQMRTTEKSNEITAIPELLDAIDVSECVVSIDAMGCQRAIAEKIREKNADYLLAVKGNQPTLYEGIPEYLDALERSEAKDVSIDRWDSGYQKSHGRIERRIVTVCPCPEWQGITDAWRDIATLVRYECTRDKANGEGKKTAYTRYYISSIPAVNAALIAGYLRGHWSIENQLHWMLDVVFKEDASTVRTNHAPENLNLLRKIALSLMRSVPTEKRSSTKSKLARAALNPDFLTRALFGRKSK